VTSDRSKTADRAINTGLGANIVLAVLKTGFGILGHSEALLADGINSMSDVAYCVVIKVFIFLARRPPDREHPYGHRQLESIAALAVGSFVITTAVALFWNAVNNVYDVLAGGTSARVSPVALWIALLTVGAKLVLASYARHAAATT
jgi:cation diffusion facilitator family transporter